MTKLAKAIGLQCPKEGCNGVLWRVAPEGSLLEAAFGYPVYQCEKCSIRLKVITEGGK